MKTFGEFITAYTNKLPDLQVVIEGRLAPWESGEGQPNPRVTYKQLFGAGLNTLGGLSGLNKEGHQVDCWADDEAVARQVAALIRGDRDDPRMDAFRGSVDGTTVQFCKCTDMRTNSSAATGARPKGQFCVSLDFEIWFWG